MCMIAKDIRMIGGWQITCFMEMQGKQSKKIMRGTVKGKRRKIPYQLLEERRSMDKNKQPHGISPQISILHVSQQRCTEILNETNIQLVYGDDVTFRLTRRIINGQRLSLGHDLKLRVIGTFIENYDSPCKQPEHCIFFLHTPVIVQRTFFTRLSQRITNYQQKR